MAVYTPMDYVKSFAILLLILWALRRYLFTRVSLDRDFMLALIPPVVLAITIRMLADAGVYEKSQWWSVTPGIYVLGVAYGAVLVGIGLALERRFGIRYWKVVLLLGAITIPPFLLKLIAEMTAPHRFLYPVALAAALTLGVYWLARVAGLGFLHSQGNLAVVFAHMLDASGTFIGIDYFHFGEEHILPEIFINLAGTAAVMIPLKLLVVGAVLYLLEKWRQEEGEDQYYRIIKITIFILGFGPGTRNSLLLTLV
ncbi:MAG: DUF63 family protein [Euryarchaeota archaeon]|nr:DUF63 family protein [Euryarchaeota archaeon]